MRYVGLSMMVMIVAALGGCASGVDLLKTGDVSVERLEAPKARVTWVNVLQDEDLLRVSGRVLSRGMFPGYARGHVDVSLVGPDGRVVAEAESSELAVAGSPKRGLQHRAVFRVEMPVTPPTGSVVKVRWQGGKHDPAKCRAATATDVSTQAVAKEQSNA